MPDLTPAMPPPSSPPTRVRPPRDVKRDRLLVLATVIVLLAACGYLGHSWLAWSRSSARDYDRGMDYASHKRYDLAEKAWLDGVKKDPHAWQCAESLGDLYTEMKRPSDAAEAYALATSAAPPEGALFVKLTKALTARGDVPDAYTAAKRAAALLPDDAEAVGEYGLLAAKTQQNHDALIALRHALDLQPSSAVYRLALVSLEIDALDFARAEQDLAPYLTARPQDSEGHYFMAVVINQKPRTPANVRQGIVQAETAFSQGRRDPRLYALLGGFFLSAGRVAGAYRVFQEGYKANPHYEPILRGYVDCATRLGRTQEAAALAAQLDVEAQRLDRIEHLKNALGFNHKDTAAALELADLEEKIGRTDRATGYYILVLRETPHDARVRAAFAAMLRRSGRADMARNVLRPDFAPPPP